MLENISPYRVGSHQHAPEIAQALGFPVCFVPHLLPVRRGLLATCYVKPLAGVDLRAAARGRVCRRARSFAFCRRVSRRSSRACSTPTPRRSRVYEDRATGLAVIVCALDNLGKGAAGQAMQNANLALGLDETARPATRGSPRMSVTAPKGFVAAGIHCGIRKNGRRDLALVRSLEPATGAAMFTANRMLAAPVVVSREHLETAQPQAVVINSGVANAATGAQGIADARATAAETARMLGIAPDEVVVLSTGVIGAPLPLDKVLDGVRNAALHLTRSGGSTAAHAIMTTDTRAKEACARGTGFIVGGMAKGSGMIHPNLATMLAVVTTDYPLEPGEAIEFLRPAVDASFNAISVDGECSTNDTVRPARERRERDRAHAGDRRGVRALRPHGLRRAREADRRRRRRRDGARRDRGARRGERVRSARDRRARRNVAAREDRAARPRRELGPDRRGRRLREVQRRLRESRSRHALDRDRRRAGARLAARRRATSRC